MHFPEGVRCACVRWPFLHEIVVTWRDLDAAGHVNNAVYLTYMETARTTAYLQMRGKERAMDLDIILARASLDFRSAATMGDTLVVEMKPGRVGETSFAFTYRITDKATGRLVCEGESVQVCYDYAKQQKKPVPPELREQLDQR